jgi:hypothetical protein
MVVNNGRYCRVDWEVALALLDAGPFVAWYVDDDTVLPANFCYRLSSIFDLHNFLRVLKVLFHVYSNILCFYV